ncbi:hypothetical protein PIB30_092087 [Stylosanthes scabra]|uniref:Uncharacterized protein n=1 Tax=Stylosanthes scabra TaxID=79078 RepID=A0ABU6ZTD1_9FABA|nr:hypothetical protein [Stylosanthes scabra]
MKKSQENSRNTPHFHPTPIPNTLNSALTFLSYTLSFNLQHCLRTSKTSTLVWLVHPSLNMSSSLSYYHNEHCFRAPHHQEIYQKYIHKKGVTPEKQFDLQEGQYAEIADQISLRGWRRLSKPRTKIRKYLVHEFY